MNCSNLDKTKTVGRSLRENLWFFVREDQIDKFFLPLRQLGGELDHHFRMQVAKPAVTMLDRHAFALDNDPRKRLNDFAERACYLELVTIEVSELARVPEKRLLKRDVNVHVEVVLNALKYTVRRLFELQDYVALQHVRHLLA